MIIGIDARLWNQTGVGRYIRNLVYNLEKIDKDNEYFLFVRDQDLPQLKVQNSNFKVVRTDIPWHSIQEQISLPNILNKYDLDIVHFPYYSVPIFYKKPFVVTIHDLIPLHFSTGKASTLPFPLFKLKFLAYKYVVSQAAKSARKIITPSNFSKQDVTRLLSVEPGKVEVVYEGTDETLANTVQSDEQKEHFLYIGNAYPHKNLEFLLDVFEELPSAKLILVGKEDYFYKRLKKIAQKRNLSNVQFFGYATDSQLSNLYKKAQALIIPSFMEGFGLPALEAMANQCLVLASDIPVLHEVCGDAALYFNPKDRENLKKLIRKIHSNTALYRTKIELGLKRSKEFSWKKTAEQIFSIYESCNSLRSR